MPEYSGPGRPLIDPEVRRSTKLSFSLTVSERAGLESRAKEQGISLSELVREQVLSHE